MAKCKDCKFYKRIDGDKGDCFGHVINGDTDSDECPTSSFQPKDGE